MRSISIGLLIGLSVGLGMAAVKLAQAEQPSKPADVQKLEVSPAKIALVGGDDAMQLIVSASLAGNNLQDLTHDCKYEVADTEVARVTTAGRVIPVGNGTTDVTVAYGDKSVKVPVSAAMVDENLPINFGNQIVPIFTKLGCNSGGCHGKAIGQNGFKLSLLGFEPEIDFNALVLTQAKSLSPVKVKG